MSLARSLLRCFASVGLTLAGFAQIASAQTTPAADARGTLSGAQLYQAACANCHGGDGRGTSQSQVGFPEPIPDFTDCSFASREPAQDWFAVVHSGGPIRAFSRRMPAFGEALTAEQIERVVAYVQSLCGDRSWPRGELNLPRAMATEKAFPEDELVVSASATTRNGARSAITTLFYEKRVGARNQLEIVVPFGVREVPGGGLTRAQFGDMSVAFKRTMHHDGARGRILSILTEVTMPTGDPVAGMGTGTTVFEPALLFAQTIGANAFLQGQAGFEFAANTQKASHEAFWRAALGATFAPAMARAWSPIVELTGAHAFQGGSGVEWSAIPQMQVSLAKRQHILASIGVRVPITDRRTRPRELVAYVLWDWFDGGLLDGWR